MQLEDDVSHWPVRYIVVLGGVPPHAGVVAVAPKLVKIELAALVGVTLQAALLAVHYGVGVDNLSKDLAVLLSKKILLGRRLGEHARHTHRVLIVADAHVARPVAHEAARRPTDAPRERPNGRWRELEDFRLVVALAAHKRRREHAQHRARPAARRGRRTLRAVGVNTTVAHGLGVAAA